MSKKLFLSIGLFLIFQANANAITILPEFDQVNDFAVFGLKDSTITIGTGVTIINGDVASGPNGGGVLNKGTINGNYFKDPTSTLIPDPDFTITGSSSVKDLTDASNEAVAASTAFDAFIATQTFAAITGTQTINGNGDINVIDVDSITLVNNDLILNGVPQEYFIFNIFGDFSLSSGMIEFTGGLPESHVLFNFPTTGLEIKISKSTSYARGTFLAPYRDISLDKAKLDGAIISGKNILIHSGAELNYYPFTPSNVIPEPSTIFLLGLGMALYYLLSINKLKKLV